MTKKRNWKELLSNFDVNLYLRFIEFMNRLINVNCQIQGSFGTSQWGEKCFLIAFFFLDISKYLAFSKYVALGVFLYPSTCFPRWYVSFLLAMMLHAILLPPSWIRYLGIAIFFFFFFIAIQRTLLTKQDKNTTNNTTNNTTKIRYVNYLLHSTSLQYTTFTFFFYFYCTPIYLASYNPGEVST